MKDAARVENQTRVNVVRSLSTPGWRRKDLVPRLENHEQALESCPVQSLYQISDIQIFSQ